MVDRDVPLLLVDFDHTLFDTSNFLHTVADVAAAQGVTRTLFLRTFDEITDGRSDAPYEIATHAKYLATHFEFNAEQFVQSTERLVERSARFLYPDAIDFLKRIRSWNVQLHLCTFASARLRKKQIQFSGIRKYFDRVHISGTRAKKIENLKSLISSPRSSILIDDHPRILQSVGFACQLRIRIRRKVVRKYVGREPPLPGVPVFRTLTEAYVFLIPVLRSFGARRHRA